MHDVAIEQFKLAKSSAEQCGMLDTPDGAHLLQNLGNAEAAAGKYTAALQDFQRAKDHGVHPMPFQPKVSPTEVLGISIMVVVEFFSVAYFQFL